MPVLAVKMSINLRPNVPRKIYRYEQPNDDVRESLCINESFTSTWAYGSRSTYVNRLCRILRQTYYFVNVELIHSARLFHYKFGHRPTFFLVSVLFENSIISTLYAVCLEVCATGIITKEVLCFTCRLTFCICVCLLATSHKIMIGSS